MWLAPQNWDFVSAMSDTDILCFHVEVETEIAAIATDAGHFDAAKRRGEVAIVL